MSRCVHYYQEFINAKLNGICVSLGYIETYRKVFDKRAKLWVVKHKICSLVLKGQAFL